MINKRKRTSKKNTCPNQVDPKKLLFSVVPLQNLEKKLDSFIIKSPISPNKQDAMCIDKDGDHKRISLFNTLPSRPNSFLIPPSCTSSNKPPNPILLEKY